MVTINVKSFQANANFGPGLYEMEACTVTGEEKRPEWRTAGTMAEGRSFLGSAAVGGKVFYILHGHYIIQILGLLFAIGIASCHNLNRFSS